MYIFMYVHFLWYVQYTYLFKNICSFFFFQFWDTNQMCHVSKKQALTTKILVKSNGIFKNPYLYYSSIIHSDPFIIQLNRKTLTSIMFHHVKNHSVYYIPVSSTATFFFFNIASVEKLAATWTAFRFDSTFMVSQKLLFVCFEHVPTFSSTNHFFSAPNLALHDFVISSLYTCLKILLCKIMVLKLFLNNLYSRSSSSIACLASAHT